MSNKHYQPFFWGDYLRDTQQLSLLEHGAYLRLIGEYWNTGKPLPADAERMRRACGGHCEQDAKAIQYVLERYFELDGDVWRHHKIDETLKSHAEHAKKASEAASKAANARWSKDAEGNAKRMRTASVSDANHSTPLQSEVEEEEVVPPSSSKNLKTSTSTSPAREVEVLKNSEGMRRGMFDIVPHMHDKDWDDARRIAEGFDIHHLAAQFNQSVRSGKIMMPQFPVRAFHGWLRMKMNKIRGE